MRGERGMDGGRKGREYPSECIFLRLWTTEELGGGGKYFVDGFLGDSMVFEVAVKGY
jgi:hypothetical protein